MVKEKSVLLIVEHLSRYRFLDDFFLYIREKNCREIPVSLVNMDH